LPARVDKPLPIFVFSVRQAKSDGSSKLKGACHVNCPFDM
jgi:hypothetical protein